MLFLLDQPVSPSEHKISNRDGNSLPASLPVLMQPLYCLTERGALMHACFRSWHKSEYLEVCYTVRKCDPGVSVNCCCYRSFIIPLIQIINIHRTLTTASLMSRVVIYSCPINIHWCWHSFSIGTLIQLFWINHHVEALSFSLTAVIHGCRRIMNKS